MTKCNKCGQEIEWKKSEKTGKNYPVNVGKTSIDDDYFHSKTCKPRETEKVFTQANNYRPEHDNIKLESLKMAAMVISNIVYVNPEEKYQDFRRYAKEIYDELRVN